MLNMYKQGINVYTLYTISQTNMKREEKKKV